MKKINLFRIIYIFIIILIALVAILRPAHIETNILRAFFSDSQKDELLINLSSKYSSNINILLESENSESLTNKKENIIKKIDTTKFELQNTDINKTLEFYKKYKNNLLSYNDYKLLKSNEYNKITEQAIGNILDPFGITLLPIEEDPFSLYTHYIMSLGNGTFMNSVDGKSYEIINLKVEPNLALSPNLLNTEVKKLIDIQKEFTDNDVKIYLTGTPIHSYYASSKSIKEINIICIISTIFVGGLILWYFHSLKILIPILLSLALGMGMGFCVSSIVFKSIHILTFVFSTTLIGICVDYSLHYLMESNIRKILKSLSVSLLSTVCAICILAFSGIELLKQIAVFTSTGLITVYGIVLLFYPLLPAQKSRNKFNLKFSKKLLFIIAIIIVAGITRIHFNDDIRTMYTPSKLMLEAEQVYKQATGINQNTSFIIVKGDTLEDILQKEEEVIDILNTNNISYYSLSKFMPSVKRQKENRSLQINLFKKELPKIKEFIPQISTNITQSSTNYITKDAFNEINQLNDFILDKNHSLIVTYDFSNPQIINGIDNVHYINLPTDISLGIRHIREICLKILIPIFVLLYFVLGIIFKFKNAHKIILPSILASIFTISFISLFQPINLFHVLAIFLITGFGLDYSIFRFNGSKNSNDAVLISCITTVFSFGLLALTNFALISSLGFVLAIGLLSSYILSIVLISKDSELTTESINSGNNLNE